MSNQPYFKPRDEIAQKDVDMREEILGVDLSALPKKKLRDLAQGNRVLHEGVWVLLDEYEVSDQGGWVRLKMILPDDEPGSNHDGVGNTWARHIIADMDEEFYVPSKFV